MTTGQRPPLPRKFKVSKTELKVAQVGPFLPVILPVMSRLFPPTFRGVDASSRDIDSLSLRAGRIDRINMRDSTNWQPLQVSSQFGRFKGGAGSKEFLYAGGDWAFDESGTVVDSRSLLHLQHSPAYTGLSVLRSQIESIDGSYLMVRELNLAR
jgi:hypothetical protein